MPSSLSERPESRTFIKASLKITELHSGQLKHLSTAQSASQHNHLRRNETLRGLLCHKHKDKKIVWLQFVRRDLNFKKKIKDKSLNIWSERMAQYV